MAKFYGPIGYAISEEKKPGVWEDTIISHNYSGDLLRNSRQTTSSGNLNDNVTVANEISIVADPFAYANFHSMRYVEYMGTAWEITKVDVQYPRLILTIGGIYNGKKIRAT